MNNTKTDNKKINKEIDKFQRSGNIQKAIETCKNALSQDENNAQLHIKLGDLYMTWHLDIYEIKQYVDEAITEYQRALESCVNSAEIYFKLGKAFYYKRELDKSVNYFKLALEYDTKLTEAHLYIAQIFMRKGDFIEAIESAENAIRISPFSSSRAYLIKAHILALRKTSKWYQIWNNIFMFLITMPFDKYARKDVFKHLSYIKFLPTLIKVSLIICFKGFNQQIIDIYRDAIEKAPGFVELYINLGRVYYELKRYDDAICEYKMAIWLDSLNIRAYYYLCQLYEEQKDFDKAIDICQKLIELQPNVPEFQCRIGQYYYLRGDIEKAVEHYQTAITLNQGPQWTSVVAQTLGFIFQENIKNLDAAVSAYQTAYSLNPNDIDIYLNLGNVFFEKGANDNALMAYRKALELSPHNAKLHCNLGYLYWGKGNIEEAIKEYEKAIKYDNTYDIAYNNLGVIYLDDLGRVQKAKELFEYARRYNPNYALANYNLARAVALSGDKVEAAKLYQIAMDINTYTNELDPIEIEEKIQDLFN